MQSQRIMRQTLEYIEINLQNDLTAAELAERAGYSFWHFCHLFKSFTGLPVGMYLRRRRLTLAASELLNGEMITGVALKYGFDTNAGFTKAFIKRYGVSPGKYIKNEKGRRMVMTPEIKKMSALTAVGYKLVPPEGEFEVLDTAAYWLGKDFSTVSAEAYAKLSTPNQGEIGAWMHPDKVSGSFYYFFGPIVNNKDFVPEGMEALDIPEAEYAVFSVPAADSPKKLNANIRNTMKEIFTEWLDSSGYAYTHEALLYEYYMGSDTFICVPVSKK